MQQRSTWTIQEDSTNPHMTSGSKKFELGIAGSEEDNDIVVYFQKRPYTRIWHIFTCIFIQSPRLAFVLTENRHQSLMSRSLCNLHAVKWLFILWLFICARNSCYCNYRFRWKFEFLRSLPQNVYFGWSKKKSMAANSISEPSQKEIAISSTVRMLNLCIIRIEIFRVIVK